MCGICGVVTANGDRPDLDVVRRMSARLVHRGPDSDGLHAEGPVALAARRLSIIDLEGGDPADRQRGRHRRRRPERRDLQLPRAAPGAGAQRPPLRDRLRHRGAGPRVRGARRRVRRAAAGDVRDRALGRAVPRACFSPATASGSSRSSTASPTATLSFASELKAMLEQPGFSRADRPPCRRRVPRLQLDPGADDDLRRGAQAAGGPRSPGEDGEIAMRRYARPSPVAGRRSPQRGRPGELADELRETLRDSVRAHLVADVPVGVLLSGGVDSAGLTALAAGESSEPVRTFSIGFEEASFDELERARLVAERYAHRPPRADPPPRRGRAAAEPGRGLRRALRRLLGGPDLPRLAAGRGRGQGRPLGRGRRRAVRRLLHLRRRPPGAAGRPPLTALAAPLVEALPSSDSKVSLDYKAKRFVRGARLPPLERHHAWKEIFPAPMRASLLSGARERLGPGRPAPRALRRDRGRRAAGPPPGPRPRHLHGRRPAGQDRPLEHGPLARAAGPVPRPAGRRVRARPGDAAQGPRLRQEAAAAPGAGAAAAEGDRQRAQAGVLDPARRLAARPARAVRPRDPLDRDARAPGLPRPRASSPRSSTATAPARRTSAVSSGA